MAYKDKHDPRYKASRMRWYYANKAKHLALSNEIGRQKQVYLNKLKNKPCIDCNKKFPSYVMDFDHRDRNTKKFNVGRMIHEGWDRIKIEVEKCDIVCANCHRIRTFKNMAH